MDVLAGTAANVRVDFLDPDGTLIPDAGSVTYTVRGTDGTILIGPAAIVTTASDTGVSISVPGVNNTIANNRQFEKRTVLVSMTSGLHPYNYRATYRVIPFINMTVTSDDVRMFCGASVDEITDDDIDLTQAYFQVAAQVQLLNVYASLDTALSSGTVTEMFANEAILGTTVLNLLPGLMGRLPINRKDGVSQFQRAPIDFKQLEIDAADLVARGTAAAAGVVIALPNALAVTRSFDPVTFWCGRLSYP